MSEASPMSFEEFQAFLSNSLGYSIAVLSEDASFLNDLAVDSIKLAELIVQYEAQLGVQIPADAVWDIQTVGDAYTYYQRAYKTANLS